MNSLSRLDILCLELQLQLQLPLLLLDNRQQQQKVVLWQTGRSAAVCNATLQALSMLLLLLAISLSRQLTGKQLPHVHLAASETGQSSGQQREQKQLQSELEAKRKRDKLTASRLTCCQSDEPFRPCLRAESGHEIGRLDKLRCDWQGTK